MEWAWPAWRLGAWAGFWGWGVEESGASAPAGPVDRDHDGAAVAEAGVEGPPAVGRLVQRAVGRVVDEEVVRVVWVHRHRLQKHAAKVGSLARVCTATKHRGQGLADVEC